MNRTFLNLPLTDGDVHTARDDDGDPQERQPIGELAEDDESEQGCGDDGSVLERGDDRGRRILEGSHEKPLPDQGAEDKARYQRKIRRRGETHTKGTAKDVSTAPIRTEWASITTAGVPSASFRLLM